MGKKDLVSKITEEIERDNNIFAIVGPYGSGRRKIACAVGQELTNSHHWSQSYWIDFEGINSFPIAGLGHAPTNGLIGFVAIVT